MGWNCRRSYKINDLHISDKKVLVKNIKLVEPKKKNYGRKTLFRRNGRRMVWITNGSILIYG